MFLIPGIKDKALNSLRNLPILETRSEHFLRVPECGKVPTNVYLRRIHNFRNGYELVAVAGAGKTAQKKSVNFVMAHSPMPQVAQSYSVPKE